MEKINQFLSPKFKYKNSTEGLVAQIVFSNYGLLFLRGHNCSKLLAISFFSGGFGGAPTIKVPRGLELS